MNLSIVCSDEICQCSMRTIEQCSNLCATLFSDLCRCSATLHTPSLDHHSVRLTVSLLEDVLAGEQLVLGGSMLVAVRPVLELLGVDWAEDTNNNSAINPETGAIEVGHMHMHMHMHIHIHITITNPSGKYSIS